MTGTRSTGNVEAGCARALKESPGACGVALGVAILTSPFEYVLAAFLTVAVGDGLAEPVGLWLGHRNRYMVPDPLFGGYNRKSVAGSMTLFVCALPIAAGTHSIQGVSAVNAILAGAAYGAVAMLIEAVSPRGLDNTLLLLLGPPVLAASGAALLSVGRARGTARGHDNFAAPACFDMATRTSERVSSRPDCSPSVLNLSRVGGTLGNYVRFLMLLLLKGVATALFRSDAKGIDGGRIPGNPWDEVRLICFLNHTSLYEPLFAAAVPTRFMWQIACRSVVPIAEITLSRPILGRLLRLLIAHPVAISREPDETWQAVLKTITEHKDAMVIIMPEGRMRRANGLDRFNKPMTARGGVTHILKMLGEGKMLMAYSGGLHHVQIPGQLVPKMFKTIRMRFELLEISAYLAAVEANSNGAALKNAIKADLDERRDRYCPMTADSTRQPFDLNVNTRLTGPRPETTVH